MPRSGPNNPSRRIILGACKQLRIVSEPTKVRNLNFIRLGQNIDSRRKWLKINQEGLKVVSFDPKTRIFVH